MLQSSLRICIWCAHITGNLSSFWREQLKHVQPVGSHGMGSCSVEGENCVPHLNDPDHGGHEVDGEGAMLGVVARHCSSFQHHPFPEIVGGNEADVEAEEQVSGKEASCNSAQALVH